ncbi:MAG TPA: tRNA (adenosine(37)-N6)-threonylcarbamoyltransferase complex ATPase subunit type 1 TsaE [Methylomusa anaerophila]|uniref:tRNA threonylcarbamoyladenosine biosynthesis protein TsaE n=1 Tax=Methylomusa anaerophila TaxID=1930071 RepID=A0A348AMK1_9FIRM|nr:tRNA (adenosine(37)-N6)-threonylcarbamoyltransferase complex ATPase subunit type 1 TsaE [Methylomusa anaerophila]BBB92299.1 tRNA threonylcarbamoyladenosine biosynthesis protein TsaE [Methylomusa anaerophila]HML90240.1 tRNA (adenosine(37)-N6)-threonylcarbamoyltransferase complex ATPase subunit type 1 TsaE [Methylomusa anaerophila]
MVVETVSPDTTFQFGQSLGRMLRAGDVVCLSGDLGAGKTLLTQGITTGLEVEEIVTSPTFSLMNIYQGKDATGAALNIYHFDFYRLESAAELIDIGFDEYLSANGLIIIEWPDRFRDYFPDEYLWIEIQAHSDERRQLTLLGYGTRYKKLCKELNQNR